jgi:beta-glucanase (GH16 family)
MQNRGIITLFIVLFSLGASKGLDAQVGPVIWQEDFNDLNNWIKLSGNGSWGWGNGELQYYQDTNAFIAPIQGEPGNNGLHIIAKQESGSGIVDQWGNPLNYTSARLTSKSKVSVLFGMVEVRLSVPDLAVGGWPAFWLQGTANYGWPMNGELDMMEMGHHKSFRDLHDTHNGGNGANNSTENEVTSANAIFYSEDAVNAGNPLGAASLAYDPADAYCRPYYSPGNPLNNQFLVYRMYWDPSSIRFTVEHNGVERDMFDSPFTIDSISREFHKPFYFLANLAVGGALTDAYNLGDPASGVPVSMPFPAEMVIDYVKVHEWNGHGSVHLGPPNAQSGNFGLFTDSTQVDDQLLIDSTGHIYVWEETLVNSNGAPFEGPNVMSWATNGKGWFGAGVMAAQPLNLSTFDNGHLSFRIRIPANVGFKIGISDAWGNQNYIDFPANQARFGLQRDGQWGQANVPISDLRGTAIDLRMMQYTFIILEDNGTSCNFELDDIYWTGGTLSTEERLQRLASNLNCYPNPSNGQLNVYWTQPAASVSAFSILDLQGRVVKTKLVHNSKAGGNQLEWNVDDLPSGVYTLLRNDEKGTDYSRLIITK